MKSLLSLLTEGVVRLEPTEEYQTEFGKSYGSKFVKGDHKFFTIIGMLNTPAGEIEYGEVDDDTVEIISIHVKKAFRGEGVAPQAINMFMQAVAKKTLIVHYTSTSKKFWLKNGFTPLYGVANYVTKTF